MLNSRFVGRSKFPQITDIINDNSDARLFFINGTNHLI